MQPKKISGEVRAYLLIGLGMLIYAIAATGFLIPHKIVGGGATGLGTIIYLLSFRRNGSGGGQLFPY